MLCFCNIINNFVPTIVLGKKSMSGNNFSGIKKGISDKNIYYVILVSSFLVALISAVIYLNNFPKFKFIQKSYTIYTTNENSRLVTLIPGSTPNIMSISKVPVEDVYKISLLTLNKKSIFDFNIHTKFDIAIDLNCEDVDGDGMNDVEAIYKRNDSLFLTIYNPAKNSKQIDELLLLTKPKKAFSKNWYIHTNIAGIQINKAGERNLVFSVWASSAIYPRSVYSFSLRKKQIVHEFEMLASPINVTLFDLDRDGEKDVIVSTAATETVRKIHDNNKYDFFHSWLIVLDGELNPKFNIKRKSSFSQLIADTLVTQKSNFLITAFRPSLSSNDLSELLRITPNGKVDRNFVLKHLHKFHFGTVDTNLIWLAFNDSLYLFNNSLDIKDKIGFKLHTYINKIVPFNSDGDKYYLLFSYQNIFIMDDSYNITNFNSFSHKEKTRLNDFTYAIDPIDNLPLIMVSGHSQRYIFKVVKHKIMFIHFVYFFILWGILLLLFFAIKHLLQQVLVYYFYFMYSTSRAENIIILLDKNNRIKYLNNSAKIIFCDEKTICSKKSDYSELGKISHDLYELISLGLEKGKEVKSEFSLSARNKIYRFEGTFIPLFVVGSYSLGSYCKLTDLSAAIETERAKVYSHSVQKIAHEIKTPLSSILFTVKTLELRLKQSNTTPVDEIIEDISLVEKEVLRMKSLTNNLLKFANLQTPKLDKVRFSNVVEGSLAKFDSYKGKGIEFIVNGCEDKFILGDMYQLIEALQVIIENGIDSMKGSGKILINCTRESINDKFFMKLTITDEGPGIKEEIKNVLFDPYVTTKKEGTGMGLAIAKKIIEDHGSTITYVTGESGTTFIIYLTCI